jgi:hypothetical protein
MKIILIKHIFVMPTFFFLFKNNKKNNLEKVNVERFVLKIIVA